MSTKKHFGCGVRNLERAKLTRSTYADITPTTRKNSWYNLIIARKKFQHEHETEFVEYVKFLQEGFLHYIDSNSDIDMLLEEFSKLSIVERLIEKHQHEICLYKLFVNEVKNNKDYAEEQRLEFVAYEKRMECISEIYSSSEIEIEDTKLKEDYCLALESGELPLDASEKLKVLWKSWQEHLAEFDALTVEDMMQAKFRMPLFIRSWQCMNNTNSINIPNDDIVDDILNSVYSPYHTMKWCLKQQELALRNFDLNMAFYESLDGEKFNREIDTFQKEHFEFRKVTDLNEYKGVSGIYIMVLDEYKQIYIGITKSKQGIKGRIGQHWSKVKPLDRLIFGGVERSILSIDSFRQFDTTRIFAFPSDLPFEELKDLEHELVEHSFSSEFLCNRTKGGGESLEQAIIERKDRTLT